MSTVHMGEPIFSRSYFQVRRFESDEVQNKEVVVKQEEDFIKSENKENVEERIGGENHHPCPKSKCERIFKFQSGLRNHLRKSHKDFSTETMVIRVVEFSSGGVQNLKDFCLRISTYPKEIIEF